MTRSTSIIPCKLTEIFTATPTPNNREGWYTVAEVAAKCGKSTSWARSMVVAAITAGAWERGTRQIISPLDGKRYPVPVYRPV